MFKVLVIAYNFPPMGLSGVQRTLKFVKYMKQFDWEPTVITSDEGGYFAYDESLLNEIENQKIKVIRVGRKSNTNKTHVSRKLPGEFYRRIKNKIGQSLFVPDTKINWAKKALKVAEKLVAKDIYHALFISGPPFSIFNTFRKIHSHYRIPLVVDYREAWYENYNSFYPTPFHRILQKKMEYKTLKAAEGIVVSNRKIKENLISNYKFLTFNDIRIITNGFDPEDFNDINAIPKNNTRMRILYSGIFSVYNTPEYFFNAFKLLTVEQPDIAKNIELHFVGFLRKENQKLIRKLNLQEFVYDHGYVTHNEALSKLISSDVVWITVADKKLHTSILPGKIYEYFAAKKPLLSCVPDGAAKLVSQEYPASFICSSSNTNEIKELLVKIYKLYSEGKFPEVDDNFLTNYRRDFLTEQLTKLFNQLLKVQEL